MCAASACCPCCSGADCVRRSMGAGPADAIARSRCCTPLPPPASDGRRCHHDCCFCSLLPDVASAAAADPGCGGPCSKSALLTPLCTCTQRPASKAESVAARRICPCCGCLLDGPSCAAAAAWRPGVASSAILVMWMWLISAAKRARKREWGCDAHTAPAPDLPPLIRSSRDRRHPRTVHFHLTTMPHQAPTCGGVTNPHFIRAVMPVA